MMTDEQRKAKEQTKRTERKMMLAQLNTDLTVGEPLSEVNSVTHKNGFWTVFATTPDFCWIIVLNEDFSLNWFDKIEG